MKKHSTNPDQRQLMRIHTIFYKDGIEFENGVIIR